MKIRRISLLLIVALIWTSLGTGGFAATVGGSDFADATLLTSSVTNIELSAGMFKFIPNSTGTYTIETLNEETVGIAPDTLGRLYDSNEVLIENNINNGVGYDAGDEQDGGNPNDSFKFTCSLTAGATYYLFVQDYNVSGPVHLNNKCDLRITGGSLLASASIDVTNASTTAYYKAGQTISVSGTTTNAGGGDVTVAATIDGNSKSTTVMGGTGSWTLEWDIDSL